MTALLANGVLLMLIWLLSGIALMVWMHLVTAGLDAAKAERERRFIADTAARLRRTTREGAST